jgi:hypothetical protein
MENYESPFLLKLLALGGFLRASLFVCARAKADGLAMQPAVARLRIDPDRVPGHSKAKNRRRRRSPGLAVLADQGNRSLVFLFLGWRGFWTAHGAKVSPMA